jgi:hypothetical protein
LVFLNYTIGWYGENTGQRLKLKHGRVGAVKIPASG